MGNVISVGAMKNRCFIIVFIIGLFTYTLLIQAEEQKAQEETKTKDQEYITSELKPIHKILGASFINHRFPQTF